jgi:hypothetical protein
MRRNICFSILFLISSYAFSWGFWAHQRINRMACFTLPPEMFGFYKEHIEFMTTHAVDPDMRRYSDPEEPPRHFIDVDRYGPSPFDSLPMYWKEAVAKFTEDSLKKNGIVPWYIQRMMYRLTEAFSKKDVKRILFYSANIGHYIADAHVPLHCTENYNGQLTGQSGIHGFWESRLPELYGDNYDFVTGRAIYIEKVQPFCWKIVRASFAALDSVLKFEKELSKETPPDRKYAYETRGSLTVKVYSSDYSKAFHDKLDGQVERRLRSAILDVGSLWYTAWVNAGSPDLMTKDEIDTMQVIKDPEVWAPVGIQGAEEGSK